MIVLIEVSWNKAYRYSKLLFYALLHLLDLKLSKQIIRRFLTKSKEIISPDLNNCDLLPIFVSSNDILTDDI